MNPAELDRLVRLAGLPVPTPKEPPVRQTAVLVRKERAQLETERDELLARLDGCDDLECPHHADDLHELDTVLWLLNGCD